MSLNKFQFIGNLTRDTQLRYMGNDNRAVATFDIAVNAEWRDRSTGEKHEKTNYFRIKLWGTQAENAGKYLGKGSQVFVDGYIENSKYEKNGETQYSQDFMADYVQYLNTKAPSETSEIE
ncbi:single-stranded DNA-binding protein (plasmid) [Xylella fastidiosa]|uniref:Single-stranded DNA-binding protein n=1 Tax=Xylella fastidiosa TaxID=2371 RepID=A0ABC8AD85_XYLFS|nr:single-stranded DNA-binding protein [Xylella fastidiosa]ALR06323.1 single-stranded DNA-binding protein [Xylella fastidiosa]ARO69816.1 single-stranded DNA-binding protein [Xylella fastidiosa subsp. pauca]AVI21864.1 single-stranded DNA-binding protein [Xylella fastidiosa]AVI23913.1 single-stranded DNA-binding protein [Xylella fastidiosa]AWG45460.1 single-stranded DNA-binding protein [Xylella fastidiosa]